MNLKKFAIPTLALTLAAPCVLFAQGPPPPPPPGYAQGGWDAPPSAYSEFQRKGFRDGIEGARRDFENHRPPTPENRDEYRHPDVPGRFRHDYRDAFRAGYHVGWQHIMQGR
ncbi:hypothetical protein [Silvibacterium dinghuense]|uniref:Uncharacterized protein n=1 Tax=Silvibacterium dinghuense TaxID=1560006 RepID=A0A4Q1SBU3_9BACT|nr:hypothetical protein [Silvibacterium dinghuense]RXS94487.1 hypothetical protein ESZ00_15580 [Silvibacterium dinghuense]GGH15786.1 hypothetical protein GCM10011586_37140 [Silvibacterium dinghuense]